MFVIWICYLCILYLDAGGGVDANSMVAHISVIARTYTFDDISLYFVSFRTWQYLCLTLGILYYVQTWTWDRNDAEISSLRCPSFETPSIIYQWLCWLARGIKLDNGYRCAIHWNISIYIVIRLFHMIDVELMEFLHGVRYAMGVLSSLW